jgi:hypothetical protein
MPSIPFLTPSTTQAIWRRSRLQTPSAHRTANSLSPPSAKKSTPCNSSPVPCNYSTALHPARTARTRTTSACRSSAQRLNASKRRSPMASRISRRLERRPAETLFTAPLSKPMSLSPPNHHAPHICTLPPLAVIQQLNSATMDIKSAYLNAALPSDANWIVTTLEPPSQQFAASTPHRNTASQMHYMDSQTPADSSTSTIRRQYWPKVIFLCLPLTTAYFIASPLLRQRTSSSTSMTPSSSATSRQTSTPSSSTSASTTKSPWNAKPPVSWD